MEKHLIVYKDGSKKIHTAYYTGERVSDATSKLEDDGFVIISTNLLFEQP